MRRVIKYADSKIINEKLNYIQGNSANNRKIRDILFEEQKKFCAYTDECFSRTDKGDIEHFDPTLKNTSKDNYYNWFLVKHQWNKEKSNRWKTYQPVLHPTAQDFEERIIYDEGDYIAKDSDEEAKNVIKLLQLDDPDLADERKQYIERKKKEMEDTEQDPFSFFSILIKKDRCRVSYLRAIKEEFGVDIWEILS